MKRYILLFLALTALVLLLSACDVSALLEGFGGLGGTTTAAATTASPTTTAPPATTAPPVTTAPPAVSNNPIKKVTMKNDILQLQYTDNAKQSLGVANIREGYNGVEILSYISILKSLTLIPQTLRWQIATDLFFPRVIALPLFIPLLLTADFSPLRILRLSERQHPTFRVTPIRTRFPA